MDQKKKYAEYEKRIGFERGKEVDFKDFSIVMTDTKQTKMGKFGDVERFSSKSDFVITKMENGKKRTEKFTIMEGFPGGMMGPRGIKIGRRNNFSVQIASGNIIAKKEKDGPEYGEALYLIQGTTMEYPDFDLVYIGESIEKHNYTKEQMKEYIKIYQQQNVPIPSEIPKEYQTNHLNFLLKHHSTEKKLKYTFFQKNKITFTIEGKEYSLDIKKITFDEHNNLINQNQIIVDQANNQNKGAP